MDFVFQRSYRGPLKGVILDWAGTTVDYGCFAPAVVFIEVYKRKGVPITIEQAREPMGAHKKVHIRSIAQSETVERRWHEVFGRCPMRRMSRPCTTTLSRCKWHASRTTLS